MSVVHLLRFEGTLGGAVGEGVGDGFFIAGKFFSAGVTEMVKAGGRDEKRVREFSKSLLDVCI